MQRELNETDARLYPPRQLASVPYGGDVKGTICTVFGRYCQQAISVAGCETGGKYNTDAANGQYLGIFQMGSHERATYGYGSDAYSQSRAAYSYFVASGSDWSPWVCKP